MDRHFTITVSPTQEISENALLSLVFSKLHQVLWDYGSHVVGVSFPAVGERVHGLGNRIRMHGSESSLLEVREHLLPSMATLREEILVEDIGAVPDSVKYRVVRRIQSKGNPERYQRRRMLRHRPEEMVVLRPLPSSNVNTLSLPYIDVVSKSTRGNHFKMFIEHGPLSDVPVYGNFTTYGLSSSVQSAMIPWF